ncbi:tRNA1(Val) (adenine(37)-N6)-methyltransferase [Frigidibacter sp. ROC022]|uniref:tRNA1(Val) (adenine(37)-N6)-methyltransferase n=1 Tax=Frigidibacter sp. ROC022 TaxID=2971796 RepID=UPI00215A84EF|nr:methyltransferase [Frigidibacter sp. ROC022]MCR8724913.1 methyltransferase [Frigidibacter sp. ROC022]
MFDLPDLDRSAFLGGRLAIWQPRQGYRAGIDPVLLAAAVPASAGQSVLELGLGAGVASLCLGARVPGLALTGVELQPAYAELARRNAAENRLPLQVVEADLTRLPADLKARSFDHVLANPPYYPARSRVPANDPGRETAIAEELPLAEWVSAGVKRLRPGGWLVMIQAATRLPAILRALPDTGITVIPLLPRPGRTPERVLLRYRKGSRAEFRLSSGLILHENPAHPGDCDDFSPWARDCLRNAAPFPAGF